MRPETRPAVPRRGSSAGTNGSTAAAVPPVVPGPRHPTGSRTIRAVAQFIRHRRRRRFRAQSQACPPHARQDALRHRASPSSRSRSASGRTRRSSRSSTRCSCARCRCAHPDELVNLAAPGPKPGSQSCNQAGDCDVVFSYPDVPRPRARRRPPFTGIAAHRAFGANLAFERPDAERRGDARLGLLLPRARAAAGARPPARPVGRRRRRGANLVAVLQPRLLGVRGSAPTRACSDQADHRQRHADDDRGRRAEGLRGHHARHAAAGLRPDLACAPRWSRTSAARGFDNRRSYWAYLFGRLKPGVVAGAGARRRSTPSTARSSTTSRRRCRRG